MGIAASKPDFEEVDITDDHSKHTQEFIEHELAIYTGNIQEIIFYCGIVIMVMAVVALVLAPFVSRESIPFLIRKNRSDKAYKEFVALRQTSKDDAQDLQHEFDTWKQHILLQPKHTLNIFKADNLQPLQLLVNTRLLSLFFNCILMPVVSARLLYADKEKTMKRLNDEECSHYNLLDIIEFITFFESYQVIVGLLLLLISIIRKVDKYCYKLCFISGMQICLLCVIYSCMDYPLDIPYDLLYYFILLLDGIYLIIPFKLELIHYHQISNLYRENNNNFKIWTMVFVGCLEQIVQILLVLSIFVYVSFGILFTGFGILFTSYWLLKNVQINGPFIEIGNIFRNSWKDTVLKHSQTVGHM